MLFKNTKSRLLKEFKEIRRGKNPEIKTDINAVVVLSGESLDPKIKTNINDTEERLKIGLSIFKKIQNLSGKPTLILTGTPIQNEKMQSLAKLNGVNRIKFLSNIPEAPKASTFDQFNQLQKIPYNKLIIITHAYHGPRCLRYARKFLQGKNYAFYLINRKTMKGSEIMKELKKIIRYSKKGDIPLLIPKIITIIQARMSSSRLPGKVMIKIGNKPMLWYVVKRVKWSRLIDSVVIATSNDKGDYAIVDFCQKEKIDYYRGSLEDVLGRYYFAARHFGADIIVRVTSDCPLIDGNLIDQGIKAFKKLKVDYLSNTLARTFPRGLDFEIFTFDALEKAFKNARTVAEREHVTPYIYSTYLSQFKLKNLEQNDNKSRYRITVDTQEDLEAIKILIEKHQADNMSCQQIIKLLDLHPEISSINEHINQKEYGQ